MKNVGEKVKKFHSILVNVLLDHFEDTYDINKDDRSETSPRNNFFHTLTPVNISDEEKESISDYTCHSKQINRDLWETGGVNHMGKIKNISSYLKKAPTPSEDFHVFTGINAVKNEPKGFLHIPSFTSTSSSLRVAADFVNGSKGRHTIEYHPDLYGELTPHTIHHILKIHVKKGQHVGAYIEQHSDLPHEKEFLINKGHTLTIKGHVDVRDSYRPTRIYRIHHATIDMDD